MIVISFYDCLSIILSWLSYYVLFFRILYEIREQVVEIVRGKVFDCDKQLTEDSVQKEGGERVGVRKGELKRGHLFIPLSPPQYFIVFYSFEIKKVWDN